MLNFDKLFNIIFVAEACTLILFFLSVTIAVAVKGKRKCKAGDVILRIFATIVFAESAIMLACSVMTMLNGTTTGILATDEFGESYALLVIDGNVFELAMPELFVALSTTIGSELVAALFLFSLVALIVDCLLANKKGGDKQAKAKDKTKKTPEQLKREAEIEKIRKIGEKAVKTTNAAAGSSAVKSAQSDSIATTEPAPDNSATEVDDAPETDWREESEQNRHAEFVGIKDGNDGDFDTFDDIVEEEQTQQSVNGDSDDDDFDIDKILNEVDNKEGEPVMLESDDNDEQAENENTDEDLSWIEQGNESDLDDFETQEKSEEQEQTTVGSNTMYSRVERRRDFNTSRSDYDYDDEHIEPNRDIYIPKMRTVVRNADVQAEKGDVKQSSARKTPVAAQKRAAAQPTAAATKKPATATSNQNKRATAAKSATNKRSTAQTPKRSDIPAEKKLPVTRRYVILDRRNAVNMFGEYLKERSQADKDKLESSINTIIIE